MSDPVSRLGLGLAAIARPAYITSGRGSGLGDDRAVETLRARTRDLLDAGYAAGIRYVDVARSYGRAEEFLAGWLADRPDTGDVEIGSKWGYRYVGGWRTDAEQHEVKDHSLDAFTEQYAQTHELLGERLGIYHVHSATLDTGVLEDTRVHRALAHLRDGGIRVGISTSGPAQADAIRRALDVEVDGRRLFTSFQSTWNPLEPSAGPALAEAADAGARVILKEVFANGRLAPGGDDGTPGARRLVPGSGRALLGIAGAPGAGKTTLARAVVAALDAEAPGTVAHVPMDGFHLADVELRRLGRRDRKGAPDTFDPDGYLALLHRLRTTTATGPVYAPAFDREIEQPVAGSIPVPATCRLVVSEGNYLLLDDPAWRPVRAAFDEVWFHETDEALRLQRLVARHVAFGKSPDAARAWVRHTDEPNARLVERSRDRADVVVACADLPA